MKFTQHPPKRRAALTAMAMLALPLLYTGAASAPAQAQTHSVQNTTTQYGYDRQGNRISITDPLRNVTTMGYDALNRPASSTDPYQKSTQTGYDALDQIRKITDPRNLVTNYDINNLGDRTALTSPDTGGRSASFDEAGNLIQQIDARGVAANHSYDELNRLTRIEWQSGGKGAPQAVPNQYFYDQGENGIGRLTGIADESGQTDFAYDLRGRMTSQVQTVNSNGAPAQTQSFAVSWSWGKTGSTTGHLTSLTYPSGNRIEYGYDAAGRVQSIILRANRNTTNLLTDIGYNDFSRVNSWNWGNGSSYSRQFDLDGRLIRYPLGEVSAGGIIRTLSYDAASRVRAISHSGQPDAGRLDQSFDYDNLHRLTQYTASGQSQSYSYDASGNRTRLQQGNATYPNQIDPASNRLQSVSGPGDARNFSYDAEGNPQTDGVKSFEFAPNGRLRSVANLAGSTTYWYNALGQRVQKIGANGFAGQEITYYVYDQAGQLLGEYDRDGALLQETVYLDGMPVAVLKQEQGSTVPYYAYSDHLNTPRVITRASDNAMVWRWDQADPFGAAQPNESLAGQARFVYNPRFPGQVYDAESGLYYNYFRDYDPQTGRYLTSDPIGLEGGINTYGYVLGNPLTYVDPNGQGAVGAAIGGRIGGSIAGVLGIESGPLDIAITMAGIGAGRAIGSAIEDACKKENQCNATMARSEAMTAAYAFAGVASNGAGATPIPWNNLNLPTGMSRGDKAYGDFMRRYYPANYGYAANTGASVVEHPFGHPDLPGPAHHACPHFHAKNAAGQEQIFPYKP
jgi:RHS repeat-associated protein